MTEHGNSRGQGVARLMSEILWELTAMSIACRSRSEAVEGMGAFRSVACLS